MKVALFGGTGFVGSYITDKLIESGHVPRILVREGSLQKVSSLGKCEIVEGDISDTNSILDVIKGVDAVIYTIGIIREFVRADVTYDNLHFEGALNCVDMAAIISNGKVVAQGTPANLIQNINAKNAYFGESFKIN